MRKKRKNNKQISFRKSILVLTVILVFIWNFCIIFNLFLNSSQSASDNSIGDMISIFGIIASVWVGLSIYNAVTKDDVEKTLRTAQNALNYSSNKINEITENNNEVLLAELISTISKGLEFYPTSEYLLKRFLDKSLQNSINNSGKLITKMLVIENYYISCSEAYRSKSDSIRLRIADAGISTCLEFSKEYDEQIENEHFLKGYINLRLGDFHYYKGNRKDYKILNIAIDYYENGYNSWFPEGYDPNTMDMKCMAYFNNVMGECINVQAQEPLIKDIINLTGKNKRIIIEEVGIAATKYFKRTIGIVDKLITIWENDNYQRQPLPKYFATYLRNYGTVLDRNGDEKCIEYYKRALSINKKDYLSHQTIANFYIKKYENIDRDLKTWDEEKIAIFDLVLPHLDLLRKAIPLEKEGYYYSYKADRLISKDSNDTEEKNRSQQKVDEYITIYNTICEEKEKII